MPVLSRFPSLLSEPAADALDLAGLRRFRARRAAAPDLSAAQCEAPRRLEALDLRGPGPRVAEALRTNGAKVDALIANPGRIVGPRDFREAGDEAWPDPFRLNVGHAVALLRAAVPHREASGQSSAILIPSISDRNPISSRAPYAAAEAGLIHAARSLTQELDSRCIRVNTLSPGSILLENGGLARCKAEIPEIMAHFEATEFPRGRLRTPEAIATVAAFLASPRSTWINAADIPVDGKQRRPSL